MSDPWLRTSVTNAALKQPGFEQRQLADNVSPADVTRAAATRPLIGKPLIRATLGPRVLVQTKLIEYCADLALAARNPTIINYPIDMKDLGETLKEIPDKAPWLIIRQSNIGKESERKSLVDYILNSLYKPVPAEPQDWYTAIDQWYKDQSEEEATPTALRSTCELIQAVGADALGRIDQRKLPAILSMDSHAEWKYPDILANLMILARANSRQAQLQLLQQITIHTRTPESVRILAGVVETVTVEMATSTDKIPQQDDSRTHEWRKKLVRDIGNLDAKQVMRAAMTAMRLAHAIRTNPFPVSAAATILQEVGAKTH